MTNNLVKRLREKAFRTETYELVNAAADRIEKLEAALRVYAKEDHWFGDKFEPITFPEGECVCCYEHFSDQGEIARKALEGKDD
jgi:predicted metal-dependent enzyme (double-stranded beta helix superfamily)